jgi:hypothetical protein
MIYKRVILLNIVLLSVTYSQISRSPLVNDFRISDDNNPSTFKQEGTLLFPNNSIGGMYTWQDYRYGELSYFAQRIDSTGNPIGANFQIFSDFDLCFAPDGSFIVLKQGSASSYYPGGWDGYYTIEGKIYKDENNSSSPFYVASGIIPWCGTGWLGNHISLARTNSHYLIFNASGGPVSFGKYDFNGNLVFQIIPNDSLPMSAYDIRCAANNANEYALFSLQISQDFSYGNLFGTFFSPSDSIIANNVLIDSRNFFANYYQSNQLKTITLLDSTYQVFYLSQDSLTLYSWRVNGDGSQVSAQPDLHLFKSELIGSNINRWITNFAITPIIDDKFSLLITLNESSYPSYKDFHTVFTFNSDSELIETQHDSTLSIQLGQYFLRLYNGDLLVPATLNQDAYQKKLSGLSSIESIKLNDDLIGSNELSPNVQKINDNEMFVTYVDEKNIIGKMIDYTGNLITNEIIIENRNLNFFSDGWSISVWYEEKPDVYQQRIGYSLSDQNFNVTSKVYLTSFQPSNTSISCSIISDSVFVITFYDNRKLFIRLYNRDGEIIKEKQLLSDVNHYSVSIIQENLNSFLVSTYQYSQMFNNELEIISPQYSKYVSYYLGELKELSITTDDYHHLYGQIYDLDGNAVTEKLFLASSSTDFYFNRLNNDYFGILYNVNNRIFVKCFSSDGKQIRDSILIHSNVDGSRKSPTFAVGNNKIFFSWSDARKIASGYDVYCSIFNLSDLTDIVNENVEIGKNDFMLFQNYPNPFNPSTRIQYQVSSNSHASLKVYDVLGNEVATLVNEDKPAGSYEVEFNSVETRHGVSLPSGVYIYTLIAGDYCTSRKMLFLK